MAVHAVPGIDLPSNSLIFSKPLTRIEFPQGCQENYESNLNAGWRPCGAGLLLGLRLYRGLGAKSLQPDRILFMFNVQNECSDALHTAGWGIFQS